jgi:hypothetical protein
MILALKIVSKHKTSTKTGFLSLKYLNALAASKRPNILGTAPGTGIISQCARSVCYIV